tara:strand:+ start:276 stop:500 length:225 start_codon:yes stop_codon:yes gene_type:complete
MQNDYLHSKRIHDLKKINEPLIRTYKTSSVSAVNINTLLNRVKNEKKDKIKENIILVGSATLIVSAVGIISVIF